MKKLRNNKGFIAVESLIAVSALLFFFVLFVSFLSYTVPKISLEKEVQNLAQIAKKQGGLTDKNSEPNNSDIETFKNTLEKMGYDKSKIIVTAKTIPSGQIAIGVTPLDGSGSNYVKRDSKELMEILISIPADKTLFNAPAKFFGIKNIVSGVYTFREVVGSERW